MMLKLLQQDLWEEFRHHCWLCQWSLNVLHDAQTSSTRSLGGILSSLQSLSLVISTFFNKIFGRNFVIIAGFVSGLRGERIIRYSNNIRIRIRVIFQNRIIFVFIFG